MRKKSARKGHRGSLITVEKKLLNEWHGSRNELELKVGKSLEYDYDKNSDQSFKFKIIRALAFWNFFIQKRKTGYYTSKQLRRFLSLIDSDNYNNSLVDVVVKIEQLPTLVFRRILWKYNICFMSLESFLRRLTPTQTLAIEQNFTDLFKENIVPRVFGKLERFFKRPTCEKLLTTDERFDTYVRYAKKASWSRNLLGLDWGFNEYPNDSINDLTDDTKIVEIRPLHFFSKKGHAIDENHIGDFVVNQENGIYWWLFRAWQKDYVFRPNRRVELPIAICPSVWKTIAVYFIFCIVSPTMFYLFLSVLLGTGFENTLSGAGYAVRLAVLGMLTPLWLTLALIKFVAISIIGSIMSISDETKDRLEKFFKPIFNGFLIFVVVVTGLALAIVIAGLAYLLYDFLRLTFDVIPSVLIVAITAYYIFLQFWYNKNVPWKKNWCWLPMAIFGCGMLAKFFLLYGTLIFQILVGIFDMLGFFAILPFFPLLMILGIFYFAPKLSTKNQDRFFYFLDKFVPWVLMPAIGVGALVAVAYVNSVEILYVFFVIGVLSGISWYLAYYYNPLVVDLRKLSKKASYDESFYDRPDYRLLLENQWFQNLPAKERWDFMCAVVNVISRIYPRGKRSVGYKLILPTATSDFIFILAANAGAMRLKGMIFSEYFIRALQDDYNAETALEMANARYDAYLAKKWKNRAFLRYLSEKIQAGCEKIGDIYYTFRKGYDILNRYCPYNVKGGAVKTNLVDL